MTNTEKLRARIAEVGVTITALATLCGMSREAFYTKLSGESEFKASEIHTLKFALHLSNEERDAIFFDCKSD